MRKHHPDCVYLTSTRHPVDAELLCEFKEEHSHATDHLIYYPVSAAMRKTVAEAQTLVLVDDEATTGKTFLNLLASLRASGALRKVRQVIAVTLTDWSGEALSQNSPLPYIQYRSSPATGAGHRTGCPASCHARVNVTSRGNVPITGKQSRGRLGMQIPASDTGLQFRFRAVKTFWYWAPVNLSGSRSCWLSDLKRQVLRSCSVRRPAHRFPLVMLSSPPLLSAITTDWVFQIMSITLLISSLTGS